MIDRPPVLSKTKVLISFAIAVAIQVVIVGFVAYLINKIG